MAAKSNQSISDILNYVLSKQDPSWAAVTSLYIAAHTDTVPVGGDQQTNEVAYPSYARIVASRNPTTGDWTLSSNGSPSTNKNLMQFARATVGGTWPYIIKEMSIGPNASGPSTVIYRGPVASWVYVYQNTRPEIDPGDASILEG